MKTVFLNTMTLTNFKGHKSLTINFSSETSIRGKNATGKSTIFDAFIWNLFGKDQFDRKDFEIIPTLNGKRLERVDSEVLIDLSVDGMEVTLRRVLHQKWVRRRGTAEEVFDGCDTLYYINDVPKKAGEYKTFVDSIVDESVFKLITNTSAFLSLHWTKQREFLFQIAGTMKDVEVLDKMATLNNKDAILVLTNILNQGKSLADFKKELSARKKKLKDDLDNIQPRIDQTVRMTPETKDFPAIENEIVSIDGQIKAIDLQLSDRSAAIRGQYEEIQQKQGQINALRTKQNEIVNDAKAKAQQDAFDKSQERTALSNKVTAALNSVKAAEAERDSAANGLDTLTSKSKAIAVEIQKLRDEWVSESAKEYKAQAGCLVCPVFGNECGDPQAIGKHEASQLKASQSFINDKNAKLDRINEQGGKLTEDQKFIASRILDGEKYLEEARQNITKLDAEHTTLVNEYANMPVFTPKNVVQSELPEWVTIYAQINTIEATIQEVKPADNTDLNQRKSELTTKRDQLKKDLSSRELIAQFNQEVKNLEKQGSDLAQQIADIEKTEFSLDAFNKAKIDECERRINGLFEITKFQLFDKTIDGNEFECCIATNKSGLPVSATNTAEKVNIGLDIIRTLSRFYNVSAPVFCDGSESVNQHLNTGSQMMFLTVTNDLALTIN